MLALCGRLQSFREHGRALRARPSPPSRACRKRDTADELRGYAGTQISAASGSPLGLSDAWPPLLCELTRSRRSPEAGRRAGARLLHHRLDPRCHLRSTSQAIRALTPTTDPTPTTTAPIIGHRSRSQAWAPPDRHGASQPWLAWPQACSPDAVSRAPRDRACLLRACCGSRRGVEEPPISRHRLFPPAPSWRNGTGAVTAEGEAVVKARLAVSAKT